MRRTVLSGILTIAAGLCVATSSAAAATPAESIVGNFAYGPIAIQINAQRAAGAASDAATGSFTGTLGVGGATIGQFAGPVTCLDVEGDRAGLFYPVKSSDPSVLADIPFGVEVTVQVSPTGAPVGLTFVPLPVTHVNSCAPMGTLFPITSGNVTITPGPTTATAAATPQATLEIADGAQVSGPHSAARSENMLVTATGAALYTLSGDTARHPKCTKQNGCFAVWKPLATSALSSTTKVAGVPGKIGVLRRNGIRQVTLGGHPLYTFAGDRTPNAASGAGIRSFHGVWQVVKTAAAPMPTTVPPTTTPAPSPGLGGPLY